MDQLSGNPRAQAAASNLEPELPAWLQSAGEAESDARVRKLSERQLNLLDAFPQLSKLPTRDLARLDDLVNKVERVEHRLADHLHKLESLAPEGRFGLRRRDPAEESRSFLKEQLAMDQRELVQLGAERESLERALDGPEGLRVERLGLDAALLALNREQNHVRGKLADAIIERQPLWLRDALGPAPATNQSRQVWERAAREAVLFVFNTASTTTAPLLDRRSMGPIRGAVSGSA